MLTKKQIKDLPKGDYPNWMLQKLFPKQQGAGRSSRMMIVEKTDSNGDKKKVNILQSFFGLKKSKK